MLYYIVIIERIRDQNRLIPKCWHVVWRRGSPCVNGRASESVARPAFFKKSLIWHLFSFGGRSTKPHVVEDPKRSFIQVILADWRRAVYWPIIRKRYLTGFLFLATLPIGNSLHFLSPNSSLLSSSTAQHCYRYAAPCVYCMYCSTAILVWCE